MAGPQRGSTQFNKKSGPASAGPFFSYSCLYDSDPVALPRELFLFEQERGFLVEGRHETLGELGQQPRQRHFQSQAIVEDVDRTCRRLSQRADPQCQPVAGPDLLLHRDDVAVVAARPDEPRLEPAQRLVLAEAMRNRHEERRAHGWARWRLRSARSRCWRSSATLRRLARNATSNRS